MSLALHFQENITSTVQISYCYPKWLESQQHHTALSNLAVALPVRNPIIASSFSDKGNNKMLLFQVVYHLALPEATRAAK